MNKQQTLWQAQQKDVIEMQQIIDGCNMGQDPNEVAANVTKSGHFSLNESTITVLRGKHCEAIQ